MRRIRLAGLFLLPAALAVFLLTPPGLVNTAALPVLPADPEAYIEAREDVVERRFGIIPGTAKRIRWYDGPAQTGYAVVYLHGFSATRRESAPTAERVADALGANLFETRLSGHGHAREPMTAFTAEDWLADAAEALAVAAAIGDRVVVIGTSTGATLALAMAGHPAYEPVTATILLSPNFRPANEDAKLLTAPAGPALARLVAGSTHSWEPHNDEQARYWSTSYPIAAAVEMMRLVDYVQDRLPLEIQGDLLILYSAGDRVVSPEATIAAAARIGSPRKVLLEVRDVGDPMKHILAGDILSPGTTGHVVDTIVGFIRGE